MRRRYFWILESRKPIFRSEILSYPLILKLLRSFKKPGMRILDVGCGTGKLTKIFPSYCFDTYGIDKSKEAIDLAKLNNTRVHYNTGDAINLSKEYNFFFDVVVSTFVTMYLSNSQLSKFFDEVFKILKKNGLFILADVHPFLPIVQPITNWEKWKSKNINYFETQLVEQTIFLPMNNFGTKRKSFNVRWYHHSYSSYLNKLINSGFMLEKVYEPKPNKVILKKYKDMWGEETRTPVYLVLQLKK